MFSLDAQAEAEGSIALVAHLGVDVADDFSGRILNHQGEIVFFCGVFGGKFGRLLFHVLFRGWKNHFVGKAVKIGVKGPVVHRLPIFGFDAAEADFFTVPDVVCVCHGGILA
jgi:hypothetical protein